MDIELRNKKLAALFSYDERVLIEDSNIEMLPYSFSQEMGREDISSIQTNFPTTDFCVSVDSSIAENTNFKYVVFNPNGSKRNDKAILLLHGLNERNWNKYLLWAEDLSTKCGVPVILFPIAFHMNRSPNSWSSPHWIMPWTSKRRDQISGLANSSFFNLALSSRLSQCPERFYVSGRESYYNIVQLLLQIKEGRHPLFASGCDVNIFAYSIGAFLAQIMSISNPLNLFEKSKLFTFCGGSIFEDMDGSAKDIMDAEAFARIKKYYLDEFKEFRNDNAEHSFRIMIAADDYKEERESFFFRAKERVKMVTMKRDTVIPTSGAIRAIGKKNASIIEELDFPFDYSHQTPFPTNKGVHTQLLWESFRMIFDRAESFLCAV